MKRKILKELERLSKAKVIACMFVICLVNVLCFATPKTVYADTKQTVISAGRKIVSEDIACAEEQMEKEENYIVNLVSRRTKRNLVTGNWKECLNFLRQNYERLIKEDNLDVEKIKSYVSAYTFVEEDEKKPDEMVNINVMLAGAKAQAYSPAKVTAYTNKYWKSYNPAYPDFSSLGGDCANFVSQALKAGGKTMKGTVASNFDNWFCRTNSINELSKVSSTWRGADAFGHYWMANAKKYKNFSKSYFSSKEKFKTVLNYGAVGDAVSLLNSNGRPYHTLIITYKEDGKLKFASHTGNHKWKSLYKYVREMGANGARIYKM